IFRTFPATPDGNAELFQVILGEVNRELGDEGRAAPLGTYAGGVDRRERAVEPGGVIAREGVAIALVQVGVVVAQVERELLPREGNAKIPRGIAFVRNAIRERRRKSVKRISRSQEPMADIGGDEPANAIRKG